MKSCLYRCRVLHDRKRPKRHRFSYDCFVFCLDLDELPALERALWPFSRNRANVYALQDRDHLQFGGLSIRENLQRYLRSEGERAPLGSIQLVTNLRVCGYVFNPVSFYFVRDAAGNPLCAIAEVANTFNEQKLYRISSIDTAGETVRFRQRLPKRFYISPFSELDTEMDFDLAEPNARLDLRISERDQDGHFFHSALSGARRPLSNRALLAATARFPFMTLQVIGAIHWQAAKMAFLKRVPYHRKADNPHLQIGARPYLERRPERLNRPVT